MAKHVAQYHTRIQSDFLILVSGENGEEHGGRFAEVIDRWPQSTDLSSQKVGEESHDVLTRFEF